MVDDTRLKVSLEASTAKLESQMNRVVKRLSDDAGKIDRKFANANKNIEKQFKSAATSASVFERELKKTDRQVDSLRKSIDPLYAATKRLEGQEELLNRALRQGTIDARIHESSIALVRAEYDLATGSAQRLTVAGSNVANGFARSRGQIQNVAFQVGDFATQVGAGTSASQALGQQLPQLLGGFGALGAVLGAVAAIGVPLGAALLRGSQRAEEASTAMDDLASAVNDYTAAAQNTLIPTDELAAKYGTATEAARTFLGALRDIAEVQAGEAIDATIDTLTGNLDQYLDGILLTSKNIQELQAEVDRLNDPSQLTDKEFAAALNSDNGVAARIAQIDQYKAAVSDLASEFNITRDQAVILADALIALSAAEGTAGQRDAALELQSVLIETLGDVENMTAEARAFFEQVVRVGEAVSEIQGTTESVNITLSDMKSFVSDVATGLGIATNQAQGLASSLASAAQNAFSAAKALAQARATNIARGPDGAVQDVREALTPSGLRREDIVLQTRSTPRAPRSSGGSSRSRSSGGGGSSSGRAVARDIFEASEAQVASLQRQIESIGKTKAEVAELTLRYRLLDAAKKQGIDVDTKRAASGRTVRQEIDEQAAAVARLTSELDAATVKENLVKSGIDDLSEALLNATNDWDSFADAAKKAIADVVLEFAKANLADSIAGIFGQSQNRTSQTFLGSLGFAGFFDGGGIIPTGQIGIAGENGPEFIRGPATVTSTRDTAAMLNGGAVVEVRLGAGLEASMLQKAGAQAVRITQAASVQQGSSLGGGVQAYSDRGTTR